MCFDGNDRTFSSSYFRSLRLLKNEHTLWARIFRTIVALSINTFTIMKLCRCKTLDCVYTWFFNSNYVVEMRRKKLIMKIKFLLIGLFVYVTLISCVTPDFRWFDWDAPKRRGSGICRWQRDAYVHPHTHGHLPQESCFCHTKNFSWNRFFFSTAL